MWVIFNKDDLLARSADKHRDDITPFDFRHEIKIPLQASYVAYDDGTCTKILKSRTPKYNSGDIITQIPISK